MAEAEQFVRQFYPTADAQYRGDVKAQGQGAAYQSSRGWAVYPTKALGCKPLGEGTTLEEAWEKAAEKVKKIQKDKQTQLWVGYLLTQGYELSEDGLEIVHPDKPELSAAIVAKTGQFVASPELADILNGVMDKNGNPPSY